MKFVAISDTHGKHHLLTLPEGDILVHAGDISSRGTEYEIRMFLDWFAGLDFKYKIFIWKGQKNIKSMLSYPMESFT